MGNGMSFKAGRDMPPGMQEKLAMKIAGKLASTAEQKKQFTCARCGVPTDNAEQIGTVFVHFCDDCRAEINREVKWQRQGETWKKKTVVCPYCGYELDGYESFRFDLGETREHACECCSRKFDVDVIEVCYYSVRRSVCEMPEDWQPPEVSQHG